MSRGQVTQGFKDKLACQNNQICELNESLVTYDKDVSMRDNLKCRFRDLQQWIENVDCKVKQSNNDIYNIIDKQLQKIKEAEKQICMLRSENSKLLNTKGCITKRLKILTRKEQTLVAEIEKLELVNMNAQNELCKAKARVDELKCSIECLKKSLKSKEEECENVLKKLTEIEAQYKCLCAAKCTAVCKLERSQADVADVLSRLAKIEECLKREQTALACQLEQKCRELRDAKAELVLATREVAELKANAEKLEAAVAELRETMAREKCEAEAAARALKEVNCVTTKKVCQAEGELDTSRRKKSMTAATIESLRCQVKTNECQLEESRQKAEALDRTKDKKCEQLERERCSLANDLKRKTKKIAELERQLCRMRQEANPCDVTGSCAGPTDLCQSADDVCGTSAPPVAQCGFNEMSFTDVLKRLYNEL